MPDMLRWLVDSQGGCTEVSDSWISKVGRGVEALHGVGWLQIIHPDDRERVQKEDVTLRATGKPFFQFYRVKMATGDYLRVCVQVAPVIRRGESWHVYVVTKVGPSAIRFGPPLIASIVRPTPVVVTTTAIAEEDTSFQRVAAAVE
jgi:PAS domain S-box-containing protein